MCFYDQGLAALFPNALPLEDTSDGLTELTRPEARLEW